MNTFLDLHRQSAPVPGNLEKKIAHVKFCHAVNGLFDSQKWLTILKLRIGYHFILCALEFRIFEGGNIRGAGKFHEK